MLALTAGRILVGVVLTDSRPQVIGELDRPFRGRLRRQNRELISANAGDQVGLANPSPQCRRHLSQDVVPAGCPKLSLTAFSPSMSIASTAPNAP